jgi:hypothetical protein
MSTDSSVPVRKVNTRVLIPAKRADAWQMFLAEPEKQWRTGYSAKALAHCWMSTDDFPPSVRNALEHSSFELFHGLNMLLGIPEHRVPLPGGGRASQTDLFVLAKAANGDLVSMAVEGKVEEPFDRLVSEWLAAPRPNGSAGPSPGRETRLAYLCNLLGLQEEAAKSLRYQLLHRTAAALIEAERFNAPVALMLVHSFSPTRSWFDDYSAFATGLGVVAEPNEIARVGVRQGIELYLGWVQGEAAFLQV